MKTTFTEVKRTDVDISGITVSAINKFIAIKKMEAKLQFLETELGQWAMQIPQEDMEAYVRSTENVEFEFTGTCYKKIL